MRLDEVLHDRQPEPQPAVDARRRSVGLPERLEHLRQELGGMPWPVSRTVISTTLPSARHAATCTLRRRSGVNLTAFESRFETICCSRAPSPWMKPSHGIGVDVDVHALGVGRRLHDLERVVARRLSRSTAVRSSRSLPDMMRETSSRSSISCA